jgi:hypothetical protein
MLCTCTLKKIIVFRLLWWFTVDATSALGIFILSGRGQSCQHFRTTRCLHL